MVMAAKRFDALARPSGSFDALQLRTLAASAPDAIACLQTLKRGAFVTANDWFPRFTNRRHGRFVKASSGQSSCVRPSSSGVGCPSCGGQRADWFGALRSRRGCLVCRGSANSRHPKAGCQVVQTHSQQVKLLHLTWRCSGPAAPSAELRR